MTDRPQYKIILQQVNQKIYSSLLSTTLPLLAVVIVLTNTLVGTTGTTDDRPEAHCAMIELLRTENGRQYGINIYDSSASSNFTTIKRATKVKITGNTLDETDGTGHCPGIGN